MESPCACAAAHRLGVSEWCCTRHGHTRVTVIPVLALMVADANAYELIERIQIARSGVDLETEEE